MTNEDRIVLSVIRGWEYFVYQDHLWRWPVDDPRFGSGYDKAVCHVNKLNAYIKEVSPALDDLDIGKLGGHIFA